jgi:hypothetical protein
MRREAQKSTKPRASQRLRARADFCRRLAVGAGDPHFATKLHALGEEYESDAAHAESQAHGLQREFKESRNPLPEFDECSRVPQRAD